MTREQEQGNISSSTAKTFQLFQKMKEAGYMWDTENRKVIKIKY